MSQRSVLIAEDDAVTFLDLKILLEHNHYIISARVTSGEDLIDNNGQEKIKNSKHTKRK